ncbi:MAG TPA: DUF1552 domain-containing protein [Polyangia bacterium]|nr:DUF1552 domain-containing protein [Polyangia bacterium]
MPWLETFETKAKAAGTAPVRRYMSLYWPNGTADGYLWGATGAGASMTLAPILQPLQPNISKIMPLGGVGNYSPWNGHVEPSHGNNCATAFTGVKANGPMSANSSISIDQAIGNQIQAANGGTLPTPLHSLQVGLSTLDSYTDGLPGPHSRSISWKDAASPLYKIISPQNVFDTLVAGGLPQTGNTGSTMPDPAAMRRQALKKSALDYITNSATTLQMRLSKSDSARLGQFLTSVRDLEQRVTAMPIGPTTTGQTCSASGVTRPTQVYAVGNTPPDYDRGKHATLMIDLVTMAYQCDLTRVVSFMLDDARSDFVYNFMTNRTFSQTGSTPGTGAVAGYHGLQHAGDQNDGFATITWWNMSRLNDLITAFSKIPEGAGTVMDSVIIYAGCGMHGGNHDGLNVPTVLAGTGGGVIKTGQALHLAGGSNVTGNKSEAGKNMQDVHLTILNKVFGANQKEFGVSMSNYPSQGVLTQLLA